MEWDIKALTKSNRAAKQRRLNGRFCTRADKLKAENLRIEFQNEQLIRKVEALTKLLTNPTHYLDGKKIAQ